MAMLDISAFLFLQLNSWKKDTIFPFPILTLAVVSYFVTSENTDIQTAPFQYMHRISLMHLIMSQNKWLTARRYMPLGQDFSCNIYCLSVYDEFDLIFANFLYFGKIEIS